MEKKTDDLPGQTTYFHVPYITIEQLYKEYDDTIVVDARSVFEFETLRILPAVNVAMGNKRKLNKYIQLAKDENKKLFIYDAVGKQVRWLQYYLEQQNAGEYYFMEGGAKAFYKIPNEMLVDR